MSRWLYRAAIFLGVLLRLVSCLVAGSAIGTPWTSGVDATYYALLASNLAAGFGFTYAHQPTALRAPLYPLFLAAMIKIFPAHAFLAARMVQFLIGLATVYLCGQLAARLFGEPARRAALLWALFLPTLAVYSSELMTECFATFLTVLLFYILGQRPPEENTSGEMTTAFAAGAIVGLASLVRLNSPILGVAVLWFILRSGAWRHPWRSMAACTLAAGLVISPWLIRNEIVFHGQVLYSTNTGLNVLEGLLFAGGPRSPADDAALVKAYGWSGPRVETNGPERLSFPSEPELDRRSRIWIRQAWEEARPRLLPLLGRKLAYFWLSLEHLESLRTFPLRLKLVRIPGLLFYWITLAFAVPGWIYLRRLHPRIASFLGVYAVLVTVAHLPFVMNTRLRVPFIDPLLAVLDAGAWLQIRARILPHSPPIPNSDLAILKVDGKPSAALRNCLFADVTSMRLH